jgi:proline dehydrogenase|tara:strand:- start:308 stop:1207 length:900 start_codon:yes stop_codon:yes gene_type:complete
MSWINTSIVSLIRFMPRWSIHPFAKTYVAGESIDETILAVKEINARGFTCTLDILGEHVQSAAEAENITREYCDLYDVITAENMNCNISIKLTHIGLALDKNIAAENLIRILKQAKLHSNFCRIDMENSTYTQQTIDLYKDCVSIYPNIGIVLQAYLKRSLEDARDLNTLGFNTRICKGIYDEPETIALQDRTSIQDNFFQITKEILSGNGFAAIATHDIPLIDRIDEWIESTQVSSDRFEFQVLYGVPMGSRLERLLDKGYTVRQYIPFGKEWFDYSLRRLKENPKIMSYVLGNLFKR